MNEKMEASLGQTDAVRGGLAVADDEWLDGYEPAPFIYPLEKPEWWVYVIGADRNNPDEARAHVYTGPAYHDLVGPLCVYGWNRSNGESFSILRGNGSGRGLCETCRKRRAANAGPVPPTEHKTRWL